MRSFKRHPHRDLHADRLSGALSTINQVPDYCAVGLVISHAVKNCIHYEQYFDGNGLMNEYLSTRLYTDVNLSFLEIFS